MTDETKGHYIAEAVRLVCWEFVPGIPPGNLEVVNSSMTSSRAYVHLRQIDDPTLTYKVKFNRLSGVISILVFRQINKKVIKPS